MSRLLTTYVYAIKTGIKITAMSSLRKTENQVTGSGMVLNDNHVFDAAIKRELSRNEP